MIVDEINELVLQHIFEHDASTLPGLAPVAERLVDRACFPG